MPKEFTIKLEIEFDKFANNYVLWERYYDFSDKLYPLHHSYIIAVSEFSQQLREYAKKNCPEIYNSINVISHPRF